MDKDNYSAVVLPLARTEALIGDLRRVLIGTPARVIPAHVTVASRLPSLAKIGDGLDRLASLMGTEPPLRFSLSEFGRFASGSVLYLKPEPDGPLVSLSKRCFAQFPDARPDVPNHVFHATIAQGHDDLDAAQAEARERFAACSPIIEDVNVAHLYAKVTGEWRLAAEFPMAGG